jgi:hypothetical protein
MTKRRLFFLLASIAGFISSVGSARISDQLKLVIQLQRHGNRESLVIFNHLIKPELMHQNFKQPYNLHPSATKQVSTVAKKLILPRYKDVFDFNTSSVEKALSFFDPHST